VREVAQYVALRSQLPDAARAVIGSFLHFDASLGYRSFELDDYLAAMDLVTRAA